jgi:4-amino-4-deoxy-L-arabinose transferase-like glycosyltransferase
MNIYGLSRLRLAWYMLATLLAIFTYFYGLDSQHIPKNGDEYPYQHITRLTADSGQLLPLQSQLDNMRNTKPPLLFWQGILSTSWGQQWTLWDLRYPSVIYTLLTALLTFLLAWKLSRQLETGFIALLTYLAFFSTYRYGRPFLINPAEVFWFCLPFFTLLYWRPASFLSRWLPLLLGIEVGIGLLYKSFALVAPVTLALAWWYLHHRDYRLIAFLIKDAWKLAVVVLMSLALFSLWFVLDPDPQAVWREFVVGENIGKFDPHGPSYLTKLLWGGSSIWALLVGYPMNAGLLALPVMALFFVAFKRRAQLSDAEKMLWIWMFSLFLVFCVPSQRSARYLLEAMPGLAVLCALNWQSISRKIFIATLVIAGCVLALFAFWSLRLQREMAGVPLYPVIYWILLFVTAGLILLAVFVPLWTRAIVNGVGVLMLLCFAAFVRPFDGAHGSYNSAVQLYTQGKQVWVPCNFRAKEEGYRFILPGAEVLGYREEPGLTAAALAARYPLVVAQVPLHQANCPECKILGQRLDIRSRQSKEEIEDMLRGNVFQHLFVRELLIESAHHASATTAIKPSDAGCR